MTTIRHPYSENFSLKYISATPLKIFGGVSKFRTYMGRKKLFSAGTEVTYTRPNSHI
jgi:hypothetical protein